MLQSGQHLLGTTPELTVDTQELSTNNDNSK